MRFTAATIANFFYERSVANQALGCSFRIKMLLSYIISGFSVGMVYALIAVGYSMVFGVLRLINFSHGSVYAFSAVMVIAFMAMGWGIWPALIVSVLLTGVLALLVDKLTLEPLRKKKSEPIAALITTIGVSYIIQNLLIVFVGSERRAFPNFYALNIDLGDFPMNSNQLVLCVVSFVLLAILMFIVRKTKIGLAMRAVEQNTNAANLMGINVSLTISLTFFIGGVSAAVAGVLIGGLYQLAYPTMGVVLGMKAFSAAVLGGIGVLYGSVIGGIVIGVVESVAAGFLGATYKDAFAFIILIVMLIIKPTGMFGKKAISKV